MTDHPAPVPYIPGPSSPAPAATATPGFRLTGEAVDLAHELGTIRKLQTTNLVLLMVALVLTLATAIFSGFVAVELWRFLAALDRAFG